MAELSYNDITRGAQEGTRDMMNLLQRVQQQIQSMGNVQQAVNQIVIIQQQMNDCVRQIQSLQNQVDQLSRQTINSQTADQRTGRVHQDVSELKVRFAAVERFAQDVSDYLHDEMERRLQNS